jgi:FkbM family methyltransferase
MPEPRMQPVVELFTELHPNATFVQIGANEDRQRGPLYEAIAAQRWRGVIVEPNPESSERLRKRYEGRADVVVEQAAVGPADGECPFFHLARTSEDDPAPPGSLRREALLFKRHFTPGQEDRVVEITVPCHTFDSLCRRHHLERLDVLALDTEGSDDAILEQVDLERFALPLIVYESAHLASGARRACRERLAQHGYQALEHAQDTWCLRVNALSGAQAGTLLAAWRWIARGYDPDQPLPMTSLLRTAARRARRRSSRNGAQPPGLLPLSDAERRYLANGYDDRTPLPPGADADLGSDNARLRELRRSYQALDLPAAQHHMWSPDRVAANVDLRYFRGDNLYQWHYPEHPRAMALVMFIYARYVERRGGRELLGVLSEDGSFGCWTAEIAGYGKVSRDLLDSINEILFLDRQLGILGREQLRVLDVGAGYGRLAHRMITATQGVADYCCVDAVPESTFLAEYYLAFRGCVPPARVVALTETATALQPGSFDLAVNVHSFSECTLAAIEWWVAELVRLRVPQLFVVPNEPEGIVSREPDGSYRDAMPTFEASGYRLRAAERVIDDPAVRELVRIYDNFYLFTLEPHTAA